MSAWEASYSIACVAGVRKGSEKKFGRETVRLSRVSRGWNLFLRIQSAGH